MLSLKKKSRQGGANLVCLSLLPKESVFELKKSKSKQLVIFIKAVCSVHEPLLISW